MKSSSGTAVPCWSICTSEPSRNRAEFDTYDLAWYTTDPVASIYNAITMLNIHFRCSKWLVCEHYNWHRRVNISHHTLFGILHFEFVNNFQNNTQFREQILVLNIVQVPSTLCLSQHCSQCTCSELILCSLII